MVGSMKVVVRGFLILSIILASSCVGAQSFGANQTSVKHAGVVDEAVGDGNDMDPEMSDHAGIDGIMASPSGDLSAGHKPYWTKLDKMRKKLHVEPAGNTVRFRCPVGGSPVPTMTWFKDHELIEKDDRVGGYKYRNNGQMIILESVVISDEGDFMCKATNQYGSINHTYELDVQERSASRPILKYGLPANKTVHVGDSVKFKCEVFSDPHPHVQWLRNIEVNGSKFDPVTKNEYYEVLKVS